MKTTKVLAGLAAGKNDSLAILLTRVLKNWLHEDKSLWAKNLETAYRHTLAEGTTIGVFSNLPAKLGKPVSELPFFQIEAARKPKEPRATTRLDGFDLKTYLGRHYERTAAMTVPFLVFVGLLQQKEGYRLTQVTTGELDKQQPLVVTISTPTSVIRAALYGHVLVEGCQLTDEAMGKYVPITIPDEAWSFMPSMDREKMAQVLNGSAECKLYDQNRGTLGFFRNARITEAGIVVDAEFLRQEDVDRTWGVPEVGVCGSVNLDQSRRRVKTPELPQEVVLVLSPDP